MRWLVEVTALGKTDTESLHIESESWQKALQVARAQRGETSPLSGFSIELLDDGCRALDPLSRLRYAVRRAPEDATPGPTAPSTGPGAPRPSAIPGIDRPGAADAAGGAAPNAALLPSTEIAVKASGKIVFKREQDATDEMPLTYREYAFLMPPGTSEAAAETLLLAQLARVRSSLERSPPGKLVNMGVFDQVIQGKPRLPPLATLCWKDWRVDPALVFPRQQHRQAPVTFPVPRVQAPGSVSAAGDSTVSVAPAAMESPDAAVPPFAGA
ncbi:MAG: hypothetical protein M3O36_18625, partial [Myxococcota bacterium]|nr:hypothetical protein [Myxococcota bacterium]